MHWHMYLSYRCQGWFALGIFLKYEHRMCRLRITLSRMPLKLPQKLLHGAWPWYDWIIVLLKGHFQPFMLRGFLHQNANGSFILQYAQMYKLFNHQYRSFWFTKFECLNWFLQVSRCSIWVVWCGSITRSHRRAPGSESSCRRLSTSRRTQDDQSNQGS